MVDKKQDRIIRYKDKLADWDNNYGPGFGYGEVVEIYYKLRDEWNE